MFYENLKRICTERNTTPTALCRSLSMSTGCVTAWNRGSIPNSETVQKIASFLGVPVSALLNDPDDDGWLDLSTVLPQLTEDEQKLLDAYRDNPTFRAAVDALYIALVPTKKDASSAV